MKKLKKKIEVTIEKTPSGYSAYTNDMNVFTTAKNLKSLQYNMLEALNLYYENSGYIINADNIKLKLDLQHFFQYYKVINSNFLAERIGMNPSLLSQYVRGKKQPSAKQTNKIINGIQTIGKELSEIKLV